MNRWKIIVFFVSSMLLVSLVVILMVLLPQTRNARQYEASVERKGNVIQAQLRHEGSGISFNMPIAEAAMSKTGNSTSFDTRTTTLTYNNQDTGKEKGLKETIILKDSTAPSEFSFQVSLDNVSAFHPDPVKHSWHFFNAQHKEVFFIPAGFMVDASGERSDAVSINISKNGTGFFLTISADTNWLSDPKRAFPVTIDPSVAIPQTDSNYIIVTAMDRFAWKLAIEYEVHEATGKLLGSDVLITEVKPGETAADIFGFLGDYLTKRNAIWLLSSGQYTLFEQSFDRLASSNFQTGENADNVVDQHVTARVARKNLLDPIEKEDYPVFSLTISEAEKVQNPQGDPAFIIQDEKIGAGAEILRPNGAGDATGIPNQIPGTTFHWDKVDEAVADDLTTYLAQWANGTGEDDYALQDTALTTETVDSMSVSYRIWGDGGAGTGQAGVRRAGSNTVGTDRTTTGTWTTYTDSSLARPGGGSWVVGDLNALQAVLKLTSDFDFDENAYSTQIYITVNYSAAPPTATPTPTPTPVPGVNIKGGTQFRGGIILR